MVTAVVVSGMTAADEKRIIRRQIAFLQKREVFRHGPLYGPVNFDTGSAQPIQGALTDAPHHHGIDLLTAQSSQRLALAVLVVQIAVADTQLRIVFSVHNDKKRR